MIFCPARGSVGKAIQKTGKVVKALNTGFSGRWKASRLAIAGYVLAVLVGVLGGLSVLFLVRAQMAWIAIGTLALVSLVGLIASGEIRRPFLAVLVFTLPLHLDAYFLFTPDHNGGPMGFRITIGDVLLVALLYLWAAEIATGRHVRLRSFASVTLPAALLVASGMLSSLFAPKPIFTAFQLFELVKGIILFLYVANRVRDEADIKWVMAGLMGAVLFQSALGLYQAITHRPLGLISLGEESLGSAFLLGEMTVIRPTGTLWHANIFAMYLGMTLPVVAALLLANADRLLKSFAGIVSFVGLAAMISTLSRSGWFGASLSTIVLALFSPANKKSGRLPRIYVGLAFLVVFLIIVNLVTGGLIALRLTADDRGAAQIRVPLMLGALSVIADHPIFGSGLNNYRYTIERYEPAGLPEDYITGSAARRMVHNVFLLLAAETGLLGLSAFLWLLAALARRAVRFLRNRKGDLYASLTVGLLASGVHLVIHNMTDYGLVGDPQIFTTFWFLAGFLVALTSHPRIAAGGSDSGDARVGAHRLGCESGGVP